MKILILTVLVFAALCSGCISSNPGSNPAPVLDPAKILSNANATIDAWAQDVTTLEASVTALRQAIADEPRGSEHFKALDDQLAQRQAELSTARIYLRFAQIFVHTLTGTPPAAPVVPTTQPASAASP